MEVATQSSAPCKANDADRVRDAQRSRHERSEPGRFVFVLRVKFRIGVYHDGDWSPSSLPWSGITLTDFDSKLTEGYFQ